MLVFKLFLLSDLYFLNIKYFFEGFKATNSPQQIQTTYLSEPLLIRWMGLSEMHEAIPI